MKDLKSFLRQQMPELRIWENVSYKELTTIGVGSSMPVLAEPAGVPELAALLKLLKSEKIPMILIGAGSNLIGMDAPYPGVGIRLSQEGFGSIDRKENLLFCGAAVRLPRLARFAAENGLRGISRLGGIPGSLGGAVRMNAGASGQELGALVDSVSGITFAGEIKTFDAKELNFSYRTSSLPPDFVVTHLSLKLESGSADEELQILKEELDRRREHEPQGRSAGCTFRNVSSLEPAGKLIDEASLRGFRLGDLEISAKHANFIVNNGSGSESDYLQLVRLIRRTVAEKSGFYLKRETCFVNPESPAIIDRFIVPLRIDVLCGGSSSEREVSLRSGAAVANALRNCGYDVLLTDLKRCEITPEMRDCDAVFPVLHGGFGENGELQALLEKNLIRFVGSDSVASELAMDKIATKKMLDRFALPTAKWKIISRTDCAFPEELNLPLIIKAPCEGSSVGIVKVDKREEWEGALEKEFKHAGELLVEEFIPGVELTVPVIEGKALDAIEIRAPHGFYDWDAKYVYKNGHTEYLCPPQSVSAEVIAEARRLAVEFYRFAGCRDMLRVDFIAGKDGIPMILEGNSLPGFTATSLVPKAAAAAGISFERLTSGLVRAALLRRPAAPGKVEKTQTLTPLLAVVCCWLYRVLLLLCAGLLAQIGLSSHSGMVLGMLTIAIILFLGSEAFFFWMGKLRK